MQLENEVYQHIRQMLEDDFSRLEIVEACMSQYASKYPGLEYNDWSEVVRKLSKSDDENVEEQYEAIATPQVPISIVEKYVTVKDKLERLVEWGEFTPIPFERWGMNGVSKWLNAYEKCITLCQCLEIDYADGFINDDLYAVIKEKLSFLESCTKSLPENVVNAYKNSKVKESISRIWLPGKISIQEAESRNVPINIFRQQVGGARRLTDLSNSIHLIVPIKERYSRGDLYLEQLSRIPDLIQEEELEYFAAYQQGNESARDAIIESVIPSGVALATRYLHKYDEIEFLPITYRTTLEDLVQYVALIVTEAFESYYPSTVSSFKKHALDNIKRRLGEFVVKEECLLSYRRPTVEELIWCGMAKEPEQKNDSVNASKKDNYTKVIYNLSNDAIEKWDNLFVEAKYSRTFLWANALIQQFAKPDIVEVSLIDLCDEMIASSWNFILDNKPYLYQFDNLRDVILGIKKFLRLSSELSATEVFDFLQSAHGNPLYTKRAGELLSGIPWGFLRTWIPDINADVIEKLSRKYTNECMYSIESSKMGHKIRINPQWKNYITSESDNMLRYVDSAYKKIIMQYNPKNNQLHKKLDIERILY